MTNPQQPGGQQGDLGSYNGQGRYVSPEEQARQQLQAAGYDPNDPGFIQIFKNMVAESQGKQAAEQQRSQQAQQLGQNVEYRTDVPQSDAAYAGYQHQQLKDMVSTVNPSQVTGVSTAWNQLANAMSTFGQQLSQAATKSGATWKGDAAESAYNFVSGLGTWSDQSGQAAQLASDAVYNQSSAAETAKNTMPDPIPFSWSDEMKSWASSNPLNLVSNIDQSFEKQQQSQDAHDQAVQVMSSYDNNLYTAASQAPAFSTPPAFAGPGTGSIGEVGGSIDGTGSSGYTGPTGSNVGASGHSGNVSGGTAGSNSANSFSGSLAGLASAPRTGSKTGSSVGSTTAQGYQPANNSSNTSSPSNLGTSGLGAMGGMPMGAMGGGFGGADGDEYSSKVGRGGSGFGPGGSSSGSAASSGSAGAQSGARAGGAGAAESASGSGRSGGAAGRSGASGMGHGGKGQGEEDEEHQRPSWLIEPDPDDVFGTAERTAPPVIGE
ncbi:hypothetical protein FPZ12_001345 [Amycolatopsis acidicola]|uniref:PPE domain-containing protein n=1 Tax=Amycolatopsis acidicola TaxID=2596893 RepID=A0A5N0VKF1_9PSEU|nr:hypothetical protein [Amycolatopsis acidicola]KAA9166867.1 hypothetical protein FPZ12_001345 [Amycolatopsis acidicola]